MPPNPTQPDSPEARSRHETDMLELQEHFTPHDRYELLRDEIHNDLLGDLPDFTIGEGPHAGHIQMLRLPVVPGQKIEDWDGFGKRYNAVEAIAIVKVRQCALVDIDTTSVEPYGYVSMSECSALIGRGPGRLLIAHLGFSEVQQVDAALAYFNGTGLSPDQVQAVISTSQPDRYTNRLKTIEDYVARGISPEHCYTFAFERTGTEYRGLIEIMAGNDGILLSEYDTTYVDGLYPKFDERPASRHTTFIPNL